MTRDDGGRDRQDEPPLELELADVPRRLPRGVGLHGADRLAAERAAAAAAPRAGAMAPGPAADAPLPADLGEVTATPRPFDRGLPGWLRAVIAIGVLAAAAYVGYRVYRRFNAPDVVAIGSPYRSSAGVTIELPPGGGWRTSRSAKVTKTIGNGWMRGDVIFRGGALVTAGDIVVLVRMHGPGAFARSMDREALRSGLERGLAQQAAAYGATARNLACVDEDTWQPGQAEVCYGRVAFGDRDIGAAAYLWMVGDDDLIGIVYVTEGVSLDALEVMAKSAR